MRTHDDSQLKVEGGACESTQGSRAETGILSGVWKTERKEGTLLEVKHMQHKAPAAKVTMMRAPTALAKPG